jgi:hypothetical protein
LIRPFWMTCSSWAAKPESGNSNAIVTIPTNELK